MRELQSILRLPLHPNIVRLYEVHREKDSIVHFVFEYMSTGSLCDMMEHRFKHNVGPLPDTEVRGLLHQVLNGVKHLHDHGVFHRDLKPENILLKGRLCKVADFSLAREFEEKDPITSYVSTRWYRAPEILLASSNYSSAVDLFAVGCIAAELHKLTPLFPGRDEMDQLKLIFSFLGTPKTVGWQDGVALLQRLRFPVERWPEPDETPRNVLQQWLCHEKSVHNDDADDTVLDFLLRLLALDPSIRMNANEALEHHFFGGIDAAAMNSPEQAEAPSLVTTRISENVVLDGGAAPLPSKPGEDSSSFSSSCTPTSVQQHYSFNKCLVTVSPPPGRLLLQHQERLPRDIATTVTTMHHAQRAFPENKRSRETPFLSPAVSLVNPYHEQKRRIA